MHLFSFLPRARREDQYCSHLLNILYGDIAGKEFTELKFKIQSCLVSFENVRSTELIELLV